MSIKKVIKAEIAKNGSIGFDDFMTIALLDDKYGYYKKEMPLGRQGDFVTSPEISSLFGEIIGLFILDRITTSKLSEAKKIQLIELGAGKGTLLKDVLDSIKRKTDIYSKISVQIIEVNHKLIELQKDSLKEHISKIKWHEKLEKIKEQKAPAIFLMNEFLDALPVKQYVKIDNGWSERRVIEKNSESFCFDNFECSELEIQKVINESHILEQDIPNEGVLEHSEEVVSHMQQITKILGQNRGLAVIFDYGYFERNWKDTIQSVFKHRYNGIFENIGKADITFHIDFTTLINIAKKSGLQNIYQYEQGQFLQDMGIELLASIKKSRNVDQINNINLAVRRLTDKSEMGSIFKTLILENI